MKASDYDRNTDCHPFWHIRRSNQVGTFNSAVVGFEISVFTASSMTEFRAADYEPTPGCWDYVVTVPCIVNTQQIAGGDEIVLKLENTEGNAAPKKKESRSEIRHSRVHWPGVPKNVNKWSFRGAGLVDG